MLEKSFDLSLLQYQLPNHSYSTKQVYVEGVPRIDKCVHALFIVPQDDDNKSNVTVSHANFFVNVSIDDQNELETCPKIYVGLFLGSVNLTDVKLDYYIDN